MLGWLTVFGMLTLGSVTTVVIEKVASISAVTASLLFSLLFFMCLLTRFVRGRA